MFREDIAGQVMRFVGTLKVIVDNIERSALLKDVYVKPGKAHASLGVHAGHFEPMREAVVETIAARPSERYRPEIGEAWRQAFYLVARAMIRIGEIR